MSRIEPVLSEINSTMDSEDQMLKIMQTLNDTVTPIPDVGGFYTFIYNAKTPRIQYDQHPMVGVTDVFRWGFRGVNFHWDKIRNYTWQEVPGQLHLVRQSEIQSLLDIPYAYYLTNI